MIESLFAGHLNFVDLAGCEKLDTESSEATNRETVSINKSLSTLGKVMIGIADKVTIAFPVYIYIFSSVATIFGPPRKQLVWASGQGVTETTSSGRAPGGPLQPRGPPRGRGACGALATPLYIFLLLQSTL